MLIDRMSPISQPVTVGPEVTRGCPRGRRCARSSRFRPWHDGFGINLLVGRQAGPYDGRTLLNPPGASFRTKEVLCQAELIPPEATMVGSEAAGGRDHQHHSHDGDDRSHHGWQYPRQAC